MRIKLGESILLECFSPHTSFFSRARSSLQKQIPRTPPFPRAKNSSLDSSFLSVDQKGEKKKKKKKGGRVKSFPS